MHGRPRRRVIPEDRLATGAQREDPAQVRDGLAHGAARGVGAEVPGPVAAEAPDLGQARPGLARIEAQREVLLVVAQPHVEGRPVALDQLVFEQQRILDARGHDHVDVLDAPHQQRDVRTAIATAQIGPDARAQILGLAHVEHAPGGGLEQVHAGPVGERLGPLRELHLSRPAAARPRAPGSGPGARPPARNRARARPPASRGAGESSSSGSSCHGISGARASVAAGTVT